MSPESDQASLPLRSVSTADAESSSRLGGLSLVEEDGDWREFGAIAELVEGIEAILGRKVEASVVLASDTVSARLNRAYRGKASATNVLSFPYQAPPGSASSEEEGYLGDVVLAAETVRREAVERGIPPAHHLTHLVLHGILHLLGYDHQTDADAEVMESLETRILADLGIADPHA